MKIERRIRVKKKNWGKEKIKMKEELKTGEENERTIRKKNWKKE